jgi:hypothetical protein
MISRSREATRASKEVQGTLQFESNFHAYGEKEPQPDARGLRYQDR